MYRKFGCLAQKEMSMETVESLYTTMVKVSTDPPKQGNPMGKYPPQFRFKIAIRETINGNVVSLMKPEPNWKIQIWDLY